MDVTNTGKRDGDDVVQMYATHLNSKVDRPAKQLEGFKRVNLAAGQTKTVELPLKAEALAYWDVQTHKWVLERDKVKITLGSSSADSRLERTVSVR
jgi:beta-glucosidase